MRKQLECPCCMARLIDENKKTVSKARLVKNFDKEEADYYLKCRKCKKEIAIIKIS